jgi:hypothetical protein
VNFPAEVMKSASVYHLPSSGTKAYPGSASATIDGAFLPMDAHRHALEGGGYVDPHEFYVDAGADLRVTDKVVIDTVSYVVQFVFEAQFGGLAHKRASLSKQA